VREATNELKEVKSGLQALNSKFQTLNGEVTTITSEMVVMRKDVEVLKRNQDERRKEVAALRTEAEKTKDAHLCAVQEKNRLVAVQQQSQAALGMLQGEIENLRGALEAANRQAGYNRGPRGRLGPLGAMGWTLGHLPILKRFYGHED